jgi:hypothetical protein
VRRLSWRLLTQMMLPLLAGTLLATAGDGGLPRLLAVMLVGGLASGTIYTVGSVLIGDTSHAGRWFGVKVSVESLAGAVLLLVLPQSLIPSMGHMGLVCGMLAMLAFLAPGLLLLPPTSGKPEAASVGGGAAAGGRGVWLAIASLFLLCAGASAIWAFADRMARISGFSAEATGELLAASLGAGIVGSLLVVAIGDRLPAARSFLAAMLTILLGLLLLAAHGSLVLYAAGSCLYLAGWAAGTPLACAEIAAHDPGGRLTALLVPAIGLGSMAGPAIAGVLMDSLSPAAVFGFSAGAVTVAAVLMLLVGRRQSQAGLREGLAP